MAKPKRNSTPQSVRGIERTFFATFKTIEGVSVFQRHG